MDELLALIKIVLTSLQDIHNTTDPQVKLAGFVLMMIALWKSSYAKLFVWEKLGNYKILVAPLLGLISAALTIKPLDLHTLWLGISGGFLAAGLHEVLDAIKVLPGIGPKYVSIINFIEKMLGAKEQIPAPVVDASENKKLSGK